MATGPDDLDRPPPDRAHVGGRSPGGWPLPDGNAGRAPVELLQPMPVPDDLAAVLN